MCREFESPQAHHDKISTFEKSQRCFFAAAVTMKYILLFYQLFSILITRNELTQVLSPFSCHIDESAAARRNLTSKGGGPLAAGVVGAEEGNDRFMIHGKTILSYGWRF